VETARRKQLFGDATAVLALTAFGILKAYALAPAFSDENIYFYMCRRIAEGALPYRDFFFAHPPFHLVPGAVVMAAFGFSLPLAKAIPALFATLGGVAIYRAARRMGPAQGIVSLCLFLFAYDMLRASSHYTGASEATALRDRSAWQYAVTFALVFGGVNLLFSVLFQSDYWDPVFRYHFMKPPGGTGNLAAVLRGITRENAWLIWSAPAAVIGLLFLRPAGAAGRRKEEILSRTAGAMRDPAWGSALAGLLITLLHLGFFSLLTRVYTFYVLPAYPGLALAGGAAYPAAVGGISRLLRASRGRRPARRSPMAAAVVAGAAILVAPELIPDLVPRRGNEAAEGEVLRRYTWREAPLPDWVNAGVHRLIWRDDRIQGAWTLSATRYLWHESRHFTAPAPLAERVKALVPPDGTVFGDSIGAPLVALLADRRIALDHADTNAMRYRSGITPPAEAAASLDAALPAVVIANSRRGFFRVPGMREWVTSRYGVAESFNDPIYGRYDLYLPIDRN
jgi:hypothetical protein